MDINRGRISASVLFYRTLDLVFKDGGLIDFLPLDLTGPVRYRGELEQPLSNMNNINENRIFDIIDYRFELYQLYRLMISN